MTAADKIYDLKAATAFLQNVADLLKKRSWFKTDGWLCSVHTFPPSPAAPESVTMHVYKKNWFNDDRRGVHFETNLSKKEWREQSVPVVMHILHGELVPGSNLKRIKLAAPFIDRMGAQISGWAGYKFRAGKYGTQPFNHDIAIDLSERDKSAALVADEFEHLCLHLGVAMDEVIATVCKTSI